MRESEGEKQRDKKEERGRGLQGALGDTEIQVVPQRFSRRVQNKNSASTYNSAIALGGSRTVRCSKLVLLVNRYLRRTQYIFSM